MNKKLKIHDGDTPGEVIEVKLEYPKPKVATMSDMKCPFCGEKIEHIEDGWCNCKNRCTGSGSIELWLQFLRTRKQLEMANAELEYIKEQIEKNGVFDNTRKALDVANALIMNYAKEKLEKKESAFVHNKIKFPEYNDNLLEEFDKQFFENGQDDDLTETALEQKD